MTSRTYVTEEKKEELELEQEASRLQVQVADLRAQLKESRQEARSAGNWAIGMSIFAYVGILVVFLEFVTGLL